jgi:[protein-PII] uridylyltransferase
MKPAKIEHVVDGARLRAQLAAAYAAEGEAASGRVRHLLHGALFRGRMIAKERLEAGEDGLAVGRLLAAVADEVVAALFHHATTNILRAAAAERLAVIGVGGYGRGELAPSSDLDLLFLRADKGAAHEGVIEHMLYVLWDMGLKVGHASRTIEENLKLARYDHTIQTALLEARLIAGDEALARELFKRLRAEVFDRDHAGFIVAKLAERDQRHARVGASRYMVEPNIKEGKGGLRDLHTLFWLARHQYGQDPQQQIEAGVFTEEERHSLRRALRFLWTVRCHLHFVTGRAEEKLTFDLQPELAKRLGFSARAGRTEVERFMTRYFQIAKEVGALTRILCAKLEADNAKRAPRGLERLLPARRKARERVEAGYIAEGGRLNIESPDVLKSRARALRLFTLAEERDLDVHPDALAAAARRARRMRPLQPSDTDACAAFLNVFESRRPGAVLRLMNETGALGRLAPEFGRIVAQMQFNMYHHYTVDEHTLKAIDAISEIERGRHKEQHPLASEVFSKVINRRALYLAMLFHDTGKGDGDQQIEGEKSARAACARLGLPGEEIDLVGWLVRHHLVMSDFAQKRDIGDPRTVAQFSAIVGSVERLRLLLILTVADIRAVGPGVWNDWKGQLLRDLYRLTEAALHGGRSDEESIRVHLAELAEQAKTRLAEALGDSGHLPPDWLNAFDDSYWLNHDEEALAWHAREVSQARMGAAPHVAARTRAVQSVTEVLVHAPDRRGLFASLAAAISASGADIAGARVHTTKEGVAFDVFSLQTAEHKPFGGDDPRMLKALLERLRRAALTDHAMPADAPASRRLAAFAIEPWVRADNTITPEATVIEASGRDCIGLLAELAHVFAEANVSIVSAHIETYGERAADVFYVEDAGGGQLKDQRRINAVRNQLDAVLRAAEPSAPADPAKTPLAVGRASTAR